MILKGRDREAVLIRNANLACAVGKLLLGEMSSWQEFLEPDTIDYAKLPRKQLKSRKYDVQTNLQNRIDRFCDLNFHKMTRTKLISLYEELKAHRTLEIPYLEFCEKYSPITGFYEKGFPEYSTVCISLWGLQYRFPEHDFSNDMVIAINQVNKAEEELESYQKRNHKQLLKNQTEIADIVRKTESAKRQVMQLAFSLLECYLNGLAWSYCQKENISTLSNRKINTLKDTFNVSLRDKIQKYPTIIFGKKIKENSCNFVLDKAKQFRDSLMHPSPFSAPEKFGGYDKLEKLFNLDIETISKTISDIIDIIEEIEAMKGKNSPVPIWLPKIKETAKKLFQRVTKDRTL
ncbi:hypothetical protein DENIS_0421 [Desulfonema ishimotonii]|uniref:Uncharacterized protein n=1 Tax=Desulfonema ishimotonii TaxID=45657 RepID=A0A401FR91_9BACT|nr:hypothetical protein [Desulfonema ishimotonii]GBC59482.1 hypothetical protein DENIS_0421 [Desulfonema ishimotonii]